MTTTTAALQAAPPSPSAAARAFRRLRRNVPGMISLVLLIIVLLAGALAPVIAPYAPEQTNFAAALQRPGTIGYLLGSDELGRDQLSRVLYGIRASAVVAFGALVVAFAVGIPLGMISGMWRAADAVVSRFNEVLLALPFLLLAIAMATITGPSLAVAAVALGISSIPTVLRVMRVETLRIGALDFVTAAAVEGAGKLRIMTHYVLPNAASSLIVQATILIPSAIIGEAMLSFLGLGVQPPMASLGQMLSDAQKLATSAPWLAITPGVAIVVICVCFNTFGDALRDALDVRNTGEAG